LGALLLRRGKGREERGGEGKGGEGRGGEGGEERRRERRKGKGGEGKGHELPPLFGGSLRLWCPLPPNPGYATASGRRLQWVGFFLNVHLRFDRATTNLHYGLPVLVCCTVA